MISPFPLLGVYLKASLRRPPVRGVVGRLRAEDLGFNHVFTTIDSSHPSPARVPLSGVLALFVFVIGRASAQAPQPDPEISVTAEMRHRFESVCERGVLSVDARRRPPPISEEYAYVECIPFNDEQGREIGRVTYCEKRSSQLSWSCREHLTNVRAILKGQPIVFSYQYSTVEKSLEVLSFVLASPQLRTLVPAQWASSKLNVHHSNGRFLVDGNVGTERYSFQLRESRSNELPFEMLATFRCQGDSCHPIWPRE